MAVSLGHSMHHISKDHSFRRTPALSRAPGTHFTVTHSSLDHRNQTLCACYRPLRPCNGRWSICRVGGREGFGGQRFVLPCKVLSVCWGTFQWECRAVWDVIGGWPWRGCWRFGEESEINTELLMFVPSIDLFLCLPFISPCLAPAIFSLSVSLIDGRAWKSSLFTITFPHLLQTSSPPAHNWKPANTKQTQFS